MPITLLELDRQGEPRCVTLNAAGRNIAGRPLSDFAGKTAKEAFEGEYGEALYQLHLAAFETKQPTTRDYPLVIDGSERVIRTVLTPIKDHDGEVVQVIGTPIDVTAEEMIEEIGLRNSEVNREMEAFISMAAHDLRSPMRKVSTIANFLREELPELDEDATELLDMLEKVAVQSFAMISDLLGHAQAAELAGETAQLETFNLKGVCEQVLHTLDPENAQEWHVADDLISGERVAVQIILRNLIDNAIKHNPEKLTLDITVSQRNPDQFELVLKDDGIGFPNAGKDHLEKGKITAESGFGLTGIRRLLASREGSIAFDDYVEGQGATIRVVLPGKLIHQPNAGVGH